MVSWLPMSSSSSPFTYKAVEVIFGRIYFYFHLQTDHWLQALQVTIFHENVGFGNMRIITLISIVSWLPISSSSSPFTYKGVEVIFRRIHFYFHLQTAPNLQDCSHSHNLPTFPEFTLSEDCFPCYTSTHFVCMLQVSITLSKIVLACSHFVCGGWMEAEGCSLFYQFSLHISKINGDTFLDYWPSHKLQKHTTLRTLVE